MKSEKEYQEFVNKLKESGYSKYPPDETWFKSFLRDENVWDEDRSCYQICWSIYDSRKFFGQFSNQKFIETPYGMDCCIMVSRTMDERVDLQLNATYSVEEVEELGASFYKWVKENIEISKR